MKFKEYLRDTLVEGSSYENEATLVLHKIVDMVDHGHVDVSDTSETMTFNVGQLIKKGAYKNLEVIIRKRGKNTKPRFGVSQKTGKMAIVMDVAKLPDRLEIDSLLSKKEMVAAFKEAFVKYLEIGHDHDDFNGHEPTNHEKRKNHNNPKTFEESYAKLLKAIKNNIKSFESAALQASNEIENIGHHGKQEVHKIAIRRLASEYFGANEKEFKGVTSKLPEAEFMSHLETEFKKKVEARLGDFYEHTIAPLLKKFTHDEE